MKHARIIAFYLPQYHPVPANNDWWGDGFTEWTNAAKAKPLFRGHYQPHIPADLGFYDLRLPESRLAQAEMAKTYGVDAFCYYHYWFAGRQIIERPFSEVLESGQPDFPFCLCWANQTWTGIWHGAPERVLMEQTYPGKQDHAAHFQHVLPAFRDSRYVTVHGLPVFLIYKPLELPDAVQTTDLWREMARQAGLNGLYLVAVSEDPRFVPRDYGFDAVVTVQFPAGGRWTSKRSPIKWARNEYRKRMKLPRVISYEKDLPLQVPAPAGVVNFPTVIPNWDNTPRCGSHGIVFHGSTPELFRAKLRDAIEYVKDREDGLRIVFVKAWNEWAEGNHLEPDIRFGKKYLQVLLEETHPPDA
jgi:lipopolysaccharide biosynthesis protein